MMVTFGGVLIKVCVSCWVLALSDTSADNIMNNGSQLFVKLLVHHLIVLPLLGLIPLIGAAFT